MWESRKSGRHSFFNIFGFKSGYIDYYTHNDGEGNLDLWEDDALVNEEGYMTDLITQRAVRYIGAQSSDAPFFLSLQYNAAHWPYQRPNDPSVAPRNAAHLQPQEPDTITRADYIAMLEHADTGIGAVLGALDAAGLSANTPSYNTALGLAMLFGRYWLAVPVLAIAGSLARKKIVPTGPGTLPTHTPLFVALLVGVVILVGALTFVPALALGPIVEHLTLIAAK